MTMVSFRTDEKLKENATKVYESLGMNLTTAINMFLKQTVIQQKYPCSLDLDVSRDAKNTYKPKFLNCLGKVQILDLTRSRKIYRRRTLSYEIFP